MKKYLLTASIALLLAGSSFAQTHFELMPSVGYTFADRQNFDNAFGRLDGHVNLGGSLMFNVNRMFGLELMYNHSGTYSGVYQYGDGSMISQGNLSIDYFMFGPVQTFNIPGSPVRPFIGAMLGASVFTPGQWGYGTDTKFTYGLQLGTNVYLNPHFGLRFKAQLLAPISDYNQGYYVGSIDNPAYSNIYQFSLNAGLVFGLGRTLPEMRPRYRVHRPAYRRIPPPYYYYR
ncbi:MAG: outer membrane beta-barrel protein [Bacteroidetes bacterium]|nr:outer membrane beta-barrel protein [Bacteroidota bacterium]